jgi:PfaD family protein
VTYDGAGLREAVGQIRQPMHVIRDPRSGHLGVGFGGAVQPGGGAGDAQVMGTLPPLYPEWLGSRDFTERHGVRFPYVAGAMANGIATPELVVAMAEAGMLGFFGAAGLGYERVVEGLDRIEEALAGSSAPWGVNLIHSPNEPELEEKVADLYIRRGVGKISASAYMSLTKPLVRVACSGLRTDQQGRIRRRHSIFAKISRTEVAEKFMRPAPTEMLRDLVAAGKLTVREAELAEQVPLAEDITVESDSGGHTDNRPMPALFPLITSLRDRLVREHRYADPIRVGAAGGLGRPKAVASAFQMGADYVMTGSINQAAVESGLSEAGKEMLADAESTDVAMAPAADMFEQGVEVQVLQRGTMFASRGAWLYELYKSHGSVDEISEADRERLEEILQGTVEEVWEQTVSYWQARDPAQIERARQEPKHKLALICRWYMGQSSGWAIRGTPERRLDYQIWCGPAMGAFNEWVEGTFLEEPANRHAPQIARNLLEGAAVITRANQLRQMGVPVPPEAFDVRPRPLGRGGG